MPGARRGTGPGISTLRDQINRIFEDVMGPLPGFRESWQFPTADVYERGDDVVVEAELPGFDIRDVEVTTTEDTVTIKGESKREQEVEEQNVYRSERQYGSIFRSFDLPSPIDPEQAKASFRNGVLTVRAPKAQPARGRKVSIEGD